ncbi:MAG: acetylxylan esterase, partial [Candidatus Latescibacteria bacterium]|nr:acetylxylan esterase [Candidatus Latescibacterota bacterium]
METCKSPFMLITMVCLWILSTNKTYADQADWKERSSQLRHQITEILTLPTDRVPLDGKTHRINHGDGYTIESITFASEPNSRVTALLYLPDPLESPVPAIIVACGHGGSKSCFYAQYAGQLYAQLGFACLIPDTIGEEEREKDGRLGARGHDLYYLGDKNPEFVKTKLKRNVLGKIIRDLIRGIDYLETRPETDKNRIGITGYSLGGATAGCVAIVDQRIKASVLCGWNFSERYTRVGKYCTRLPYIEFDKIMNFGEMTALLAPHAPTLFMCGTKDAIIDPGEDGAAVVRELQTTIAGAQTILDRAGIDGIIESDLTPGAGHRPFFLSHTAVKWMQKYLMTSQNRKSVPSTTISFGEWVDSQGQQIEELYNTERNERGLQAVDSGAIYRDPKELACFPECIKPDPVYTMQGWVDTTVKAVMTETITHWMEPQKWVRDIDEPVISLGEKGEFDDMHIFAPCVAFENSRYIMWYCGSRGGVEQRVFKLGYAKSTDGIHFTKANFAPVYEFGDGKHSVLTPTLLRNSDGSVLRENGQLRMWFAAADLSQTGALHTLHETTSGDGIHWSSPSPPYLDNVYAPTIIKEYGTYRMWYTDVSVEPW